VSLSPRIQPPPWEWKTIGSGPVVPERLDDGGCSPRPSDPAVHDATASAFHQAGVCATLEASRAASVDQLLLEVAAGTGVALLPEPAVQRGGVPGVELHPVVHPALQTTMVIVTRDEAASPALTSLVDELAARADQRSTSITLLAA
jgi:DNA-binding transcriptional LysR family regulator